MVFAVHACKFIIERAACSACVSSVHLLIPLDAAAASPSSGARFAPPICLLASVAVSRCTCAEAERAGNKCIIAESIHRALSDVVNHTAN
jgi:hypothetical protein